MDDSENTNKFFEKPKKKKTMEFKLDPIDDSQKLVNIFILIHILLVLMVILVLLGIKIISYMVNFLLEKIILVLFLKLMKIIIGKGK